MTTGIAQTIVYTSASVYTTNTLTSTGSASTYTAIVTTSETPEQATAGAGAAGNSKFASVVSGVDESAN